MSKTSFARRGPALWAAALVIAGACTAGVDRMVGPKETIGAPSLAVVSSSPIPGFVISQVYGGGGNSGSTYKNDFIELYNGTGSDIDLTGKSVQYTSAGGTSWQVTRLKGTLASGHYYLVWESQGAGGTTALPDSDALGVIPMSATAGKVALVNSTTPLTGTGCPFPATNSPIIDYVGFGTGTSGANCYEGNAPTPTLSNTNAALRKDGGRTETNDNGADFASVNPPTPRNSASTPLPPLNVLVVTVTPAAPSALPGSPVSFTATAAKSGASVAISSATWSSSNTGVATIDAASGAATTVAPGTTTISVAVVTAQGNATGSTLLTVTAPPTPAASVTVSPATWNLKSTQTKQFTATAKDADSAVTKVTFVWTSSDPAVAAIDAASGIATGKKPGTATITATAPNGVAGTAKVTVTAGNVTLQPRADSLPVGFQTQLFVASGSTDQAGSPVTSTTVTWSSSAPAIVSVNDSTGVITAKALGSAVITATAKSDGLSAGSTTIVTNDPAVSPSARVGHNTELGLPTDADPRNDVIIARRQYTLSYNPSHGGPNWVSWNLDATHKGSASRCNCFTADPAVADSGYKAYDTNDWINGGVYSRGHMSPSADWADTPGDNAPTFYLSNMLPQNQALNGGAWGNLENYLRTRATGGTEIYIIAGGIFTKNRAGADDGLGFMNSTTGAKIAVPDSIWKIAVIVPDARSASEVDGSTEVIVAAFDNAPPADTVWKHHLTTIDKLQKSTGYDFLSALPESVQCRLESRNCAPVAAISGAGLAGGDEGETLTFSGATSSDPDGDALSYQWSIAGAPAGSQPTLTHTFGNDGAYEIRLVVTDIGGRADTATATVAIRNVAPTVPAFPGAAIDEGGVYTATGSFADPGDDFWSATVDYGDGSGEQPLTLGTDKRFTLSHAYADNGSYTVRVTVAERSASAASGTNSATVTVANVAPSVAALSGATILRGESYAAAGSFSDPGALDTWSATVDYGDGSGTNALELSGNSFALDHQYASAGTYTLTVRVTDKDGGVGTTTAVVVVQSALQGIANLSSMLPSLGLNKGETNSLQVKLNATRKQLSRDADSEAAPNVLDAFLNEMDALVRSGRVSESAAAPLTDYARRVSSAIGA